MTLSRRIFELPSFQIELQFVVSKSVGELFPTLEKDVTVATKIDWNYLLLCASSMAHSDDPDCQDAALRIAQCCLSDPETAENQRIASSVIFHKLTNMPAIDLAIEKHYLPEDYSSKTPLPLSLEKTKRDVEQTIFTVSKKPVYLNKFQKTFYENAKIADHISVSAPTSSGKSFVLNTFVLEQLQAEEVKNIVYLVPTRALINQVEDNFFDKLKKNSIKNVYLSSVPGLLDGDTGNKSNLLIFTQERLHWFLNEHPEYRVDFLIIDEAQKISDGGRGILLQQKVEDLVTRLPKIKVLFCSAFSENPEILLEGLSNTATIKTGYIAVNQNLIWLSRPVGKPRVWIMALCLKSLSVELGKVRLTKALSETEKLPMFAFLLGSKEGGNLVYVNGQAEAEKTAIKLHDLIGENEKMEDQEIDELIELVKKLVHSEYALVKILKRGVAFHYGNMPLIIRKEIERLYSTGHIKYLICTSTLLEGVNLPARSIFIRKPKRGSTQGPMSEADFWNLAGRAGRLTKEFQGNIICIDPEEWEVTPVRERSKLFIKRAIAHISENNDALLEYIRKDTPKGTNDEFEYAFSYYFVKFLKNGTLQGEPLDPVFIQELESECTRVKNKVIVPDKIIYRNPGISPLSQQALLDYFQNYDGDIQELVPVLPEEEDAAQNHYLKIIGRINQTLTAEDPRIFYHAILVVSWMKGFPLARIIGSNIKYWRKNDPDRKLSRIIRDTMSDIEEYVRFKFAKYSSCYIDILKYHLSQERADLLDAIPELNTWVEFGVSQRTQISLITLGLSRHTAIELSGYIKERNCSRQDCVDWLLANDTSLLDLPETIKKEIVKVKDNHR